MSFLVVTTDLGTLTIAVILSSFCSPMMENFGERFLLGVLTEKLFKQE